MDITLGRYISSIYRHQSIVINHILKDLKLSSGQYLFLIRINRHPGLTQKELSEMIHIDRANTNRAIKKLETLNYIYTAYDEKDRRNKRSFPTELGKTVFEDILERLNQVTQILSKDISEDELQLFSEIIEKMDNNIQTAVKDIRETYHDI